MIGIIFEVASKSYKNLIIRSHQGCVLLGERKNAINILDNSNVRVDLTAKPDGILSKVIVTDKLAKKKKEGRISVSSLEEIQAISRILSTNYITSFNCIQMVNLQIPTSTEDDVKSVLSICSESTSVENIRGKFISHVRSRTLVISNQVLSDSDTKELVSAMKDRLEMVYLRYSVSVNTESMAKYLPLISSKTQ